MKVEVPINFTVCRQQAASFMLSTDISMMSLYSPLPMLCEDLTQKYPHPIWNDMQVSNEQTHTEIDIIPLAVSRSAQDLEFHVNITDFALQMWCEIWHKHRELQLLSDIQS